jgi:hypothetical protein
MVLLRDSTYHHMRPRCNPCSLKFHCLSEPSIDCLYIYTALPSSSLLFHHLITSNLKLRDSISPPLSAHFPLALSIYQLPTLSHPSICQTHLSHISSRSQHRRHKDDVCERDPRSSLGPAEVLMTVGDHVCGVCQRPSHLFLPILRALIERLGSWRTVVCSMRRTVPFYDRGILVEHCGLLLAITLPWLWGEARCILPWL